MPKGLIEFDQPLLERDPDRSRQQVEIIQLAQGATRGRYMGKRSETTALQIVHFPHEALIRTPLPKQAACFTVPLGNEREWFVNGVQGSESSVFLNIDLDETLIYTPDRNSLSGGVPRDLFVGYYCALIGRDPGDADIAPGNVQIDPTAKSAFIRSLTEMLRAHPETGMSGRDASDSFGTRLAHLLAFHLASASRHHTRDAGACRTPYALVRLTCDFVETIPKRPILLADLCAAARVSAPTLTWAFQRVTGTSPVRFFRLQRLAKARELLLASDGSTGAVKAAAMANGFTELGRFSGLYRSIYGELPSQTLGG